VHIGEPLKTIVVEPLKLSALILPPEPEPCGMPETPERNCCLGETKVRRGVLAIHTGT